jgi:DNA polymerase III delta prime subunit
VIGQESAVSAVVDRIATLKAGLNDPGKPIAVLLFAGPTGTGETELARTLAEYLLGRAGPGAAAFRTRGSRTAPRPATTMRFWVRRQLWS